MNDRFRFRIPITNKDGKFEKFVYFDLFNQPAITCRASDIFQNAEQCTGLKDKNGRLIYEGDILKDHRQEGGIVKWNNDSAGFAIYEILETGCCVGGLFDWLDKDTNYEVIGNIHENPELLEDK